QVPPPVNIPSPHICSAEPLHPRLHLHHPRHYSMLRGEEIDPEIDERSGYELRESLWKQPPPVVYNPHVPIETFDFIITDECHRSIYNLWRQVLEYFDAYLIGLPATPSKQTIGFFNKHLVMH